MITTHPNVLGWAQVFARRYKAKALAGPVTKGKRGIFYLELPSRKRVAVNYDLPLTEDQLRREIVNLLVFLG